MIRLLALLLVLSAYVELTTSISMGVRTLPMTRFTSRSESSKDKAPRVRSVVAAVLPGAGGPVTGTLTVGVMNGISLFSNILLARFALSWFPQLTKQFPILRPINTVTEPYLRIFRQVIPPIGGFDISALPAIFILDILSQTTAAVGAEISEELKSVKRGEVLKQQQQQLQHVKQ